MLDKTRKHFPQLKKNTFLKQILIFFFRKMLHSAENLKKSSTLAKRFVSSKSRGTSVKKKWEKRRTVPKKRRY